MDLKLFASLAVIALLLFGCTDLFGGTSSYEPGPYSGGELGFDAPKEQAASAPSGMPVNIPSNLLDDSGRMVVKSGDVDLEVQEGTIKEKHDEVKDLVKQSGGEVYATRYYESGSSKNYYITVKLPPSAFEEFPEQLAGIGNVKSLDTSVDDVTMQYVDLQVRISNLEKQRERLLELYDMAENVSDLLDIQKEITRVQTDIEYYTAQKIQLENKVEKATLVIRIYEEKPVVDTAIMMPLGELVNIFLGSLQVGLVVVTALSGFIIPVGIGLLVLYGIYKLFRRVTSHKRRRKK